MLTIRPEQMQAMGAHTRAQFEQRIIKYLRKKFPARTQDQSDQKIQFVVQAGIKDAESHGIEFENDIRRYIEYLVIYGTRLDERKQTQWIANVLQQAELDGTTKMDRIDEMELQQVRSELWED